MSASSRLELTWPNKDKFLLVPKDESGKPVWVEPDHPAAREVRLSDFTAAHGAVDEDDPFGDNLMFTGDSLDVLRILAEVPEYAKHYRGRVKLAYLDPPFNTGQTFTHYDDWMEHSTWLSFMRDRMLAIKDLLAPDGSVWVHLDDAEVHRMRCLMDEVFGAENFVATVVWNHTVQSMNNQPHFSNHHNQVLVFRRTSALAPFVLPREDRHNKAYRNTDNDPRGPWRSGDVRNPAVRPNLQFELLTPSGKTIAPPDNGWRWSEETIRAKISTGEIIFTDDETRIVRKIYLADQPGRTPENLWGVEDVGGTREANSEMKALFGAKGAFSTPKPERLLERVLLLGTQPGDIVLDCFSGSGTTAAVAHKMGRRWVTAEILPETVKTFTSPRLQKVVAGEDPGGITESVGWAGGGGFREVAVAPSMYEVTPVGVMLADWATNGRFARAVAGQLGFEWQSKKHAPFCGIRGRMRLAVFDGAVGVEEAGEVLAALGEKERVTIVAKVVLPGVEEYLAEHSRGSRVKKAPRDLLAGKTRRRRKAEETPA
jgi:adenine-specific DNA-methyltransferase